MYHRLLGAAVKRSNDGGSTSRDAERAGGRLVEDGKKIEISVTEPQTSSEGTSAIADQQMVSKPISNFNGKHTIYSVAFLTKGKDVLSGGQEGNIRQWRLEDGKEIETPMDVGEWVYNIAVSRDGRWIVSGSGRGDVSVWSVENHKRVGEMKGHAGPVWAVDISPDGTKIASGSYDATVCIWMRRTNKRLLTLEHANWVAAVKFSPDGSLLAIAIWNRSVRVYNSETGRLLVEFLVRVGSDGNQSLAWDHQMHLYVISLGGEIYYLDVSTGETLLQWPICLGGEEKRGCIALSSNCKFLVGSSGSSISFWDTTTCTKIGLDVSYPDDAGRGTGDFGKRRHCNWSRKDNRNF
ncbi:WD40-repeat-containing domain protein [Chiua virens]|nr:WD40-repeat-containing domain protein [Chiua virens]